MIPVAKVTLNPIPGPTPFVVGTPVINRTEIALAELISGRFGISELKLYLKNLQILIALNETTLLQLNSLNFLIGICKAGRDSHSISWFHETVSNCYIFLLAGLSFGKSVSRTILNKFQRRIKTEKHTSRFIATK